MKKRFLSMLLALCMVMSMMPSFTLFANAAGNATRNSVLDLSTTRLSYVNNTGSTVTANPTASDITNSGEGWAWYRYANTSKGYSAYTLELNGIHFNITQQNVSIYDPVNGKGIYASVPSGITIVVNGTNIITTQYNQGMTNGSNPYFPMTIKSTTNGTLDITVNASDMSAIVAGGLTTENVNFNVTCSEVSNSALNSTDGDQLKPLVFNGGTANLKSGISNTSNAGLRGTNITIKGGAVLTCSGNYGILGSSINIEDGIIHSSGVYSAFSTNPTLNAGLSAIDNKTNAYLPSGTNLTTYKDIVITSANTKSTVTVNSDTPADITSVMIYNGSINIPLSAIGNNQYQAKIASGTYKLKINGQDCGKSFTASENKDLNIDVYKLFLGKSTGISAVSGGGYYISGGNVTIDAQAEAGYSFDLWKSSNSTALADSKSHTYTFVMPAQSVILTASATAKSAVVLNTPVFTNDKLGYSFKSATINNFDAVTSITFSATKSTAVKQVPSFLTPTSKLESIDGETRTATYVFEKGISVSQAEEFIRGIIFEYKAGTEISITVDNNPTKLPDGAKITEFKHPDGISHYYMYVNDPLTWINAYNAAKSYSYMGMKGYLATITSANEDKILDNISLDAAWSGGTRLKYNGSTTDPTTFSPVTAVSNENYATYGYYYWACGPEAGTQYWNSAYASGSAVNGAYTHWTTGQPNNYIQTNQKSEECMEVHYNGTNDGYKWNDRPSVTYTTGYFVEFSNYIGGMDSQHSDDKTAVGKYNLATDGGVKEAATVTLNAPVYGSGDQSVFSFDNATIANINKIYTLTIQLNNYTNVLSKPESPAVSNELKNIAGDTNTITYQFKDGITKEQAQSFLRGLKFRYGGLKDTSTTNVSVTIDGNNTNLPQDASITEYNGHYYMFVPADSNGITWPQAYNNAKTFSYMGLRGYLATITSADEDRTLTNISTSGAWSAGSRMLKADGTKIADENVYTLNASQYGNEFYWACGPEAGLTYFTGKKYNSGNHVGYSNWGVSEPNGTDYSPQEVCMQVNFTDSTRPIPKWNDLPYNFNDMQMIYCPKGYFVEFSDYSGGRVDDYVASATGNSSVPIAVSKGDVFNTVKDGGTYYVDTVLTVFDRNITGIKVNNTSVSSGYTLPGNTNVTYAIVATDLGGNTATTTVTMKTIASISEPIKNLTVNNVKMTDIPAILAAKATLKSIDQTTASAAQKTEIAAAIANCNNLYFALFNATATAQNGTNGWYKNGISDITLTAPAGFEISTSSSGAWTSAITINKADSANKTATYYLKETATEEISSAKTFSYKVDTQAPTGKITIKSNQFTSFLNSITFGLFFKNTVDVTISGADNLSTPVTISYQKVKAGENYSESGTWTNGASFSVTANEKFIIYAKITDNAGNTTIINSNGVVVYTDSTQNTADVTFSKTSTTDVTADVNLNGNTVKEIKNGSSVISNANYTVAEDGKITFKASYLDTLAVGSYTLTVSYNPMGESFVAGGDNQAPSTTTITLAVKAKAMTDENGNLNSSVTVTISPETYTYNGKAFAPTVTVKDGDKTLSATTDYSVSWTADMTNVGEKTATITFKGIYSGTTTKKANVANATLTDTTNKTQSTTYNGKAQSIPTPPSATAVNNQAVTVKYSTDGNNYTLTSAPTFTNAGSYTVYYQLSAPNHTAVTGQIAFTVKAATNNAITDLVLAGWTYGDTPNTPTAKAAYGTPAFTYSSTENGTYASTVPTQAGTYYVKASVAATADYNGCEATKQFAIGDKTISAEELTISGVDAFYVFTNSAIEPKPVVKYGDKTLVEDTDYTLSYENNIAIGTNAKVIVTLKGNYSGAAEKTFEIRYGTATEDEIKNMITLPDFNSNGWHKEDIVITAKDGFTLCKTATGTFGSSLTISDESTKTGTDYTFYIKATNGSVYERTLNYKLDKVAPEGSISIGNRPVKDLLRSISFGLLFNKDVDVTVSSSDTLSGIAKVEVYKSDAELTKEQLSTVKWTEYTTAITENAKDGEKFIYYARITDNAGNIVIVNSQGAEFDLTPPVIHGVTNGETYYTTQIITTKDANEVVITVNGNEFSNGGKINGNQSKTYEIIATDKAGNTTKVTVAMKPINDISDNIQDISEDDVTQDDQKKIEDIKNKAEAVDTTNATDEEKKALQDIIEKCDLLLKKIADNSNKPHSPQTGDTNNMIIWAALLFVSGGVLTSFGITKKRRKISHK